MLYEQDVVRGHQAKALKKEIRVRVTVSQCHQISIVVKTLRLFSTVRINDMTNFQWPKIIP